MVGALVLGQPIPASLHGELERAYVAEMIADGVAIDGFRFEQPPVLAVVDGGPFAALDSAGEPAAPVDRLRARAAAAARAGAKVTRLFVDGAGPVTAAGVGVGFRISRTCGRRTPTFARTRSHPRSATIVARRAPRHSPTSASCSRIAMPPTPARRSRASICGHRSDGEPAQPAQGAVPRLEGFASLRRDGVLADLVELLDAIDRIVGVAIELRRNNVLLPVNRGHLRLDRQGGQRSSVARRVGDSELTTTIASTQPAGSNVQAAEAWSSRHASFLPWRGGVLRPVCTPLEDDCALPADAQVLVRQARASLRAVLLLLILAVLLETTAHLLHVASVDDEARAWRWAASVDRTALVVRYARAIGLPRRGRSVASLSARNEERRYEREDGEAAR